MRSTGARQRKNNHFDSQMRTYSKISMPNTGHYAFKGMAFQTSFRYIAIFLVIVILMVLFTGLFFNPSSGLLPAGFLGSDTRYSQKVGGSVATTPQGSVKNVPAAATEPISPNPTIPALITDSITPAGIAAVTSPVVSLTVTSTSATPTSTPVATTTYTAVPTSTTSPFVTITETPVETNTVAPPVGKNDISIYRQVIYPHSVTISQGTIVIRTNRDSLPRSIISTGGAPVSFNSGLMNPGATFGYTFTRPGLYQYQTGLPPADSAVIIVI
jgi:hypothetical protein